MRAALLALVLAPAVASAQGILIPRCPRPVPERPIMDCAPTQSQVVRTRSDVRVELRDRVLRYEVEERFVNRGGMIGEADYMFPLPKGAAFRDLKLSIDGELVAGETMNATEARRIYEDIVRRQKDPALVEWMGHGMLRTRIFPIQPGEERRVVVRFEAVAEREGDALRVDYFRGAESGRRTAESAPVSDRSRTRLTLTYRTGGELGEAYSPTHELDVSREGVVRRVAIDGGGPDITVLVALRRATEASVSLLPHAVRGEPGYALITVTPPTELERQRLPRDVTFVLDVSGSMSGTKMEQAKASGRQLLRTLTPRDRFRLIDFSTDVRSFRDEYVFATTENVRAAVRYLDELEASGSTNISGALRAALNQAVSGQRTAESDQRLPLVLFMTDGAATVGERDPAAIAASAARMRGDARVFTFGVGADVNIGLIEQLALEGRGTPQFIRPDESVERAVELLATRLQQPVLTDVRLSFDGDVRLSRMYPTGPLDIFAGQDLVVLARYSGSGSGRVVVEGRSGGRTVRWASERNFPASERDNAFVPRLWATQRIGWLAAEKRRGGGNAEIDAEIRELGERFGIPTEFTSYLVLEPGMVADMSGPRRDRRLERGTVGNAAGGVATGAVSAAPPSAPAPQAAFESARASAEQRAAKSVAAADAATIAVTGGASSQLVRAGRRMFRFDGERWVDVALKPTLRVYKVQAYSAAYFTLLEKLPELKEAFALGDKVTVAGASVAIELTDRAEPLTDAELNAITSGWSR